MDTQQLKQNKLDRTVHFRYVVAVSKQHPIRFVKGLGETISEYLLNEHTSVSLTEAIHGSEKSIDSRVNLFKGAREKKVEGYDFMRRVPFSSPEDSLRHFGRNWKGMFLFLCVTSHGKSQVNLFTTTETSQTGKEVILKRKRNKRKSTRQRPLELSGSG